MNRKSDEIPLNASYFEIQVWNDEIDLVSKEILKMYTKSKIQIITGDNLWWSQFNVETHFDCQ